MKNNDQIMIDFNYLDNLVNEEQETKENKEAEKHKNRKYFKDIKTLEELKKEYFRLNKKYHPDINKNIDPDIIKSINAQYDEAFEKVKNIFTNKDGEQYTKENDETVEEYKNIIRTLIKCKGLNIEILGSFIWVGGDTYPHKKTLKDLKFRWSKNKQKWYKSPKGYRRYGNKKYSYKDIQNMYGVIKVGAEEEEQKKIDKKRYLG